MDEEDVDKFKINWMSSKEAAAYLGISLQTLYKFIDDGSLGAFHMGRVIRLRYEDVLEFLEGQRITKGELSQLLRRKEAPEVEVDVATPKTNDKAAKINSVRQRARTLLLIERERIARALEEIDRALAEEDFDDDFEPSFGTSKSEDPEANEGSE
ncbi:MAG: helix-turn-helix domain-containing protein [Actinomycetota bacterium]|nr:helix-turn-helix domain-containing protein [Actinomycetota bacterium]